MSERAVAEPQKKVLVWVYCLPQGEDPLFLLLRTTPERGGFWQPVTGSVEKAESIEAGALREFSEETALRPKGELRQVSSPFEFTSRWGGLVREFPFLVEIDSAERPALRLDPQEHTAFQWCTSESAFELLKYESNARVLRDIVQELNRRR